MPSGYFAPAAGLLWKLAEHYGLNAAELFRNANVSQTQIADPELRLPNATVERLWQEVALQVPDDCMGLTAATYLHPSHLGPLGYGWLASSSLRNALHRLNRYIRLLTSEREILIEDQGQRVLIETRLEPTAEPLPERADISMTVLMSMCRWNLGLTLQPRAVSFKHARPPCAARFDEFFRCEVEFSGSANLLVLGQDEVDRPLTSANPQIARLNDQYLAEYLARHDRGDLQSQVKQAIAARIIDGKVRLAEVARELNTSARTLQRRLEQLGTSFADLVDKTRREITEHLLREPHRSLNEIAFSTGFGAQSSFTNAVRRWTGLSPSVYRQQLLGK